MLRTDSKSRRVQLHNFIESYIASETNLKVKQALQETTYITELSHLAEFQGKDIERPRSDFQVSFNASYQIKTYISLMGLCIKRITRIKNLVLVPNRLF
jgi:hypothetical protein